jgi:hypothetical protein
MPVVTGMGLCFREERVRVLAVLAVTRGKNPRRDSVFAHQEVSLATV